MFQKCPLVVSNIIKPTLRHLATQNTSKNITKCRWRYKQHANEMWWKSPHGPYTLEIRWEPCPKFSFKPEKASENIPNTHLKKSSPWMVAMISKNPSESARSRKSINMWSKCDQISQLKKRKQLAKGITSQIIPNLSFLCKGKCWIIQ